MTFGVTLGLTFYAFLEKTEISMGHEGAVTCTCVMFCFAFTGLFFSEGLFDCFLGAFSAIVFGVFVIIDVTNVIE
jgi:hypothetical protein